MRELVQVAPVCWTALQLCPSLAVLWSCRPAAQQGTYLLLIQYSTAWCLCTLISSASAGQPLLEQLQPHMAMGSFRAVVFADTS